MRSGDALAAPELVRECLLVVPPCVVNVPFAREGHTSGLHSLSRPSFPPESSQPSCCSSSSAKTGPSCRGKRARWCQTSLQLPCDAWTSSSSRR